MGGHLSLHIFRCSQPPIEAGNALLYCLGHIQNFKYTNTCVPNFTFTFSTSFLFLCFHSYYLGWKFSYYQLFYAAVAKTVKNVDGNTVQIEKNLQTIKVVPSEQKQNSKRVSKVEYECRPRMSTCSVIFQKAFFQS